MKSDALGVLASHLMAQGFLFNGFRNRDLSNFKEPFQRLIELMGVIKVDTPKVYRARKINIDEDVDTGKGIYRYNGKIVGGFDEDNSRIPPSQYCNIQRLNRKGEQVFYIAEEKETAIQEQKVTIGEYLSIATFDVVGTINILDFSAYTREELYAVVTDKMEKEFENIFQEKMILSARQLYVEVQRFLTILESSKDFYEVSNDICDLMKENEQIDGIRYYSYYKGHNLGIWRYRPGDYFFKGSEIVET